MRYSFSRGFTLVEVMVAVVIIGILSSVVMANMTGSGARGRDADRKSDLRNLQSAIETYKQRYGRYPAAGCSTPAEQIVSESTCANYITGIDAARPFVPDFIQRLPTDPRRNGQSGFTYITNGSGTVYKAMVVSTVESEIMATSSPMRSCDVGVSGSICPSSTLPTNLCSPTNPRFRSSYGVWGGFADAASDAQVRTDTSRVLCR